MIERNPARNLASVLRVGAEALRIQFPQRIATLPVLSVPLLPSMSDMEIYQ